MPSTTESATASSRRSKLAFLIALAIVFLPALIAAVLYYRHDHAKKPTPGAAASGPATQDPLWAAGNRYLQETGELDKASESFRQLVAKYPQDRQALVGLGILYGRLGQFEKAAEVSRQALQLAPDMLGPYENLVGDYLALQRPEDAHEAIREAQAKGLDSALFHSALYITAFHAPLGADKHIMADQLQWFSLHPQTASYGLALAADSAAYSGHVLQARGLADQAVDSALQMKDLAEAAVWQENAALREAAFGEVEQARRDAEAGLKLAPASAEAEVEAAFTFALLGNDDRAEALAKDVAQQRPQDTQVQRLWLPTIRAQMLLNENKADEALNTLGPTLPMDLGFVGFGTTPSCLYPTYVRGLAYLAHNDGTAAASEFQKILDHAGIVWNCWTGALAHLGLARANIVRSQELYGEEADEDRLSAIMAYKDFFKLWKDADPDTPVLKQARDEFAKVQQ